MKRGWAALALLGATSVEAQPRVLVLREAGAQHAPASGDGLSDDVLRAARAAREATLLRARGGAEAALREARQRFLGSEFLAAAAALEAAIEAHIDVLIAGDRGLLLSLLHWAGACRRLGGEGDAARARFARAVLIAPEEPLPTATFQPEVEAEFEAVRRDVSALSGESQTLRSVPSGARIVLDGRDEGATPLTLRVTPGVHHLRLEHTGFRPFTGAWRIEPGGPSEREVVLGEASSEALRGQVEAPDGLVTRADAATLARIAGLYRVSAVRVLGRDGGTDRWPTPSPTQGPALWPWWVGAGVLGVGLGVGLFFYFRPEPEVVFVAP